MSDRDDDGLSGNRQRSSTRYAQQPPPVVLVAVFGSLIIGLDDRGLHVAVIDQHVRECRR